MGNHCRLITMIDTFRIKHLSNCIKSPMMPWWYICSIHLELTYYRTSINIFPVKQKATEWTLTSAQRILAHHTCSCVVPLKSTLGNNTCLFGLFDFYHPIKCWNQAGGGTRAARGRAPRLPGGLPTEIKSPVPGVTEGPAATLARTGLNWEARSEQPGTSRYTSQDTGWGGRVQDGGESRCLPLTASSGFSSSLSMMRAGAAGQVALTAAPAGLTLPRSLARARSLTHARAHSLTVICCCPRFLEAVEVDPPSPLSPPLCAPHVVGYVWKCLVFIYAPTHDITHLPPGTHISK